MEDRRELIEKKYGFQVKNQYRARGAILFDTKDGPLLLREKMKLTGHFEWENEVKEHLRKNGMTLLDFAVKNVDGEYLTEAEDGSKYVLYRWFFGEECDCKNVTTIRLMAENLGQLHSSLQNFYEEPVLLQQPLLSGMPCSAFQISMSVPCRYAASYPKISITRNTVGRPKTSATGSIITIICF